MVRAGGKLLGAKEWSGQDDENWTAHDAGSASGGPFVSRPECCGSKQDHRDRGYGWRLV
jgi:hypothetical protein